MKKNPNTAMYKIERHLRKGKTITPMEALVVFGVFRLASIVHRLRQRGFCIYTVLKTDENGHKYASYAMEQDKGQRSVGAAAMT